MPGSAIEDQLREIEARLILLEDERAIRQLISSYGPAVDSGRSGPAAELWTDDGVYDYKSLAEIGDGIRGEPLHKQAIVDMLEGSHHQRLIGEGAAHTLGPAVIDIAGDTAVATNYSVIFRRIGMSVTVYRLSANRWELIRTPRGWRARKRITRLLEGSGDARARLGQATTR